MTRRRRPTTRPALRWVALIDVCPFDPTHQPSDAPPGFVARDGTAEHLAKAEHAAELLRTNSALLRPIAVCEMRLVPRDRRYGDCRYQRLDGFGRWWGHRLVGAQEVLCEVYDEYIPGVQHGMSMTVTEGELGKVAKMAAEGIYDAGALPYASRLAIEDCVGETVHVHIGNVRQEFTPQQFLWLADRFAEAARVIRRRRGL